MREGALKSRGRLVAKTAGFLASAGIVLAIIFTILSANDYRIQESQGIEPGPSPQWILTGTNVGLICIALGFAGLFVGLGLMMVKSDEREPQGSASGPG